ncbi:MarC family protein [Pedobacter nototheniae]|uniref:MarC family protein n=1 Tax=Pedobacter nototheniae TaxID=2488994 RepID=UPI00292EB1D5|nr:MarC family protein [Pedobacter nototheniae]
MPVTIHSFIHLLFIGIITLFPVVNPIGSAFIVSPYFAHLNNEDKKRAVKRITLYAFCICTVSLFGGHYILELFGISIPVIQLAGGIMICKMGWEFLSSDDNAKTDSDPTDALPKSEYHNIENKLFYPITFPVTTGAGTLSVLFTLSAHSATKNFTEYLINTGAIILAVIVMCILIYIFYLNTKRIINYLGSSGEKIINRITAFLIFCVGLQIAISGIEALIKAQ